MDTTNELRIGVNERLVALRQHTLEPDSRQTVAEAPCIELLQDFDEFFKT